MHVKITILITMLSKPCLSLVNKAPYLNETLRKVKGEIKTYQ